MSGDAPLAGRIDDLEARLAFQERTIEELNAVVAKQWRHIDELMRLVRALEAHAQATSPIGDPRNEPPPPHY
jgi:SlyX protein